MWLFVAMAAYAGGWSIGGGIAGLPGPLLVGTFERQLALGLAVQLEPAAFGAPDLGGIADLGAGVRWYVTNRGFFRPNAGIRGGIGGAKVRTGSYGWVHGEAFGGARLGLDPWGFDVRLGAARVGRDWQRVTDEPTSSWPYFYFGFTAAIPEPYRVPGDTD